MDPTLPQLTRTQLEQLAAALPELDLTRTRLSAEIPGLTSYLDFYRINFAATMNGVQHNCGSLHCHGFRIAIHCWTPAQPIGSLLVVHGYYDHIGNYGNAIRFGLENGYAVLALDLPGHGLSSGEPASINSFDQYGDVLAGLLAATASHLPQPLHALGQSTGGAALLNYLWRHTDEHLERIVLLAPLILPFGWHASGRWLHLLLRSSVSSIRRTFRSSSHDTEYNEFIAHRDPLQYHRLPTVWVDAMKQWDRDTKSYPELNRSLLILQGSDDTTVDLHYNMKRLRAKLPRATFITLPGARHQIVNETPEYREPAFTYAKQWLREPTR